MSDAGALTAVDQERDRVDAKRRLWVNGVLSWKFKGRPWQKRMYDFVRGNWTQTPYLMMTAHRRSGKSSTGLVICLEECLKQPNITCAVICGTKDQATAICEESFVALLNDCPQALMPRRIKNDFSYVFDHNNSKIVILPAEGVTPKRMRGRKFRFAVVTEAAFITKLHKTLLSILLPTFRDVTGETYGTLLIESTPPDDTCDRADAEKYEQMWSEAEIDGRAFFLPLSQNIEASPIFVEQCKKDSGGEHTVEYRREYECQFILDSSTTVIPEFTKERAFGSATPAPDAPLPIVREVPRPAGSDLYGALDPGGRDLSGLLWGYYHFEGNLVVIEDELTLLNMTSDDLASKVKAKETELWGATPDGKLMRVADNSNVILLYDLLQMHKLKFWATAKDNKDAQINQLRIMVRDGLLVIHPRCRLLIKTLLLAKRAKQERRGFERGEEIGHADLLDALLYLIRNVRRHAGATVPTVRAAEQNVRAPEQRRSSGALALGRAMGRFRR